MRYPPIDIANYFIWRVNSDTESGDNITNLKLRVISVATGDRVTATAPLAACIAGTADHR